MTVDLVVPTVGRPALAALLEALARASGPLPRRVLLVDDRRPPARGPLAAAPARLAGHVAVLRTDGRGPAAARNAGWRASDADWIAFLDDDVVPAPDWPARLRADLEAAAPDVAGSQGRIVVPLPADRPPTDWERHTAGLAHARWATADIAYRRATLERLGGFDERFRRAYREDADLGLRVVATGHRIVRGTRVVRHPPRPAGPWASVRLQAGNADDVLMWAIHGPGWRAAAAAPRGRAARHAAIAAAAVGALAAAAAGGRNPAAVAAALSAAGTAELAWARIAPGPRTRAEILTMLATSLVLPFAATLHRLRGIVRWVPSRDARRRPIPPRAVLLDRDGTLVADVPANADPARVVPLPGARAALDRLRAAGIPLAIVTNQAAVGDGRLAPEAFAAVNRRIEDLLGPIGPWIACTHPTGDACGCRKPAPGLVVSAARALGVPPAACVLVGDTGADVAAALAAGARAVLVPNAVTRPAEIVAAPAVARDLAAAVDLLLGRRAA